ncbi:hypothetical protein GQR58_029987 [Nymphon striatum]|nr:hypothetical protein GQR58_029987 [Nymphon striatum]
MENEFKAIESDDVDYEAYWNKTTSVHLRKHLLENYNRVIPEAIFSKAFESDTIPIRQVLSRKMDSIPNSLKSKYETLLADNSYVTIENALFKLWSTYPEEKAKYLEQTKDIIGLPNKNVRLLWLTLAIVTNDYNARKTQDYFLELSGYTSERYGSEVRMGAFQYLHQAVGLNNASLKSLIKATTHHSWQFKKFARNLVDELLKDADYEVRLQEIAKELNEEELNMKELREGPNDVVVTVSNLSLNQVEYKSIMDYTYDEFCDWIWISANYTPFMSLVRKNGSEYADGGLGAIVPIEEAILRGAGYVDVVVSAY